MSAQQWPGQPVQQWPGQAVAPQQAPQMGMAEYIDGLVRQAAQGATFGFMDEGAAALRTGAGMAGDYGEALGQERARDSAFREQYPIASTVANIAGAVASPASRLGMLAPAAAGASRAATYGRGALSRGAVAGGVGGAAAGAGEGEGLAGTASGTIAGGLMGAATGGAIGAGLSVGSSLGGRLLHALGLRNPEINADRQILRAMERDRVDPAMLRRPQQGPGIPPPTPEAALVDMAGRNVVQLGATAANTPGRAMEVADQFQQARRAGRPERIAAAVDDGFGGGGGTRVMDEIAALRQERTTNARPLYDAAFRAEPPDTPELRRVMSVPLVQQAAAENMRLQQMEAAARGEAFAPNPMRLLDAAKRGLDERINATLDPVTRQIIPGRGQESIALKGLRDALVRELDAVPEYAAARAAWSGPTRSMDAMAQGQAALRMNPDAVAATTARMPASDMEFMRLGAGRAVTDMTRDPARAATAARTLIEDRNMQRRLEALIPDPAQRAQFMATLGRENDMAAVERAISPRANSQTARLLAGGEDMANDPPGGMLAALLMGQWANAARQGGEALYRRGQGINPATSDALADRLFSPATAADTARRLTERQVQDRLTAQRNAQLLGLLLRGTGAGVGLEAVD